MSLKLTDLQAEFIAGYETMSEENARQFLALLEADYGAEFREDRIAKLERRLKTIERLDRSKQQAKVAHDHLIDCGREFREITDRWEANGVTKRFIGDGAYEIWDYGGTELYRWGGSLSSRPTIIQMLADAQRIDAEVFGKGAK